MSTQEIEIYETPDVEKPQIITKEDIQDDNILNTPQTRIGGYTELLNKNLQNSSRYEGYSETDNLYEKYLHIKQDFDILTEKINQYISTNQSITGVSNILNFAETVNENATKPLDISSSVTNNITDIIKEVKHDETNSKLMNYKVLSSTSIDSNYSQLEKLNDKIKQLHSIMTVLQSIFSKDQNIEEPIYNMEVQLELIDDSTLKTLKSLLIVLNREIPLSGSFLSQNFSLNEEEENIVQYTQQSLTKLQSYVNDISLITDRIRKDQYKYKQIASMSQRLYILSTKQKQLYTTMQRDQDMLTKLDTSFNHSLTMMNKNLETIKQRLHS